MTHASLFPFLMAQRPPVREPRGPEHDDMDRAYDASVDAELVERELRRQGGPHAREDPR